jgi:NDP-hexose-3-ketoreductase
MKSNNLTNIGVLGIASIATKYVIPSINLLPEKFKLSGLASRTPAKANSAAELYKTKAYHSYETLLEDENITAVYIPLPNSLHYRYVKMALEKGKHVLVEKSMGCELFEVIDLVKLAKNKGLILLENFQFRFHSQITTIQKMLNEGTIGDLRSMRVSFGFPPFQDDQNIRYDPILGGGALLDVGAYAMKIAPIFLGNKLNMAQASWFIDKEKNVDIWGQGVIQKFNSNLSCQFSFGFDHSYQCSLELWGSKGKLYTNRIFTAPPNYEPLLILETINGSENIILPEDNHFKNILSYFHKTINEPLLAEAEYEQNILQAELIESFKKIVN